MLTKAAFICNCIFTYIKKIPFEYIVMFFYDEKMNFQQVLLSVFFNASLRNKHIIYFLNLTDPKHLNIIMHYIIYCMYLHLSVISLFLPHGQCDSTTDGLIALFKNCSVRKQVTELFTTL